MTFFSALIKRFQTSLVSKYVSVFLLGAILPVILLGGWSLWMSYKAVNMHISGSVYQILKEKIDYSTLLLQEIESLIANISSVEDITNTLRDESEELGIYDKLRLQAKIGYILSGYINIKGLESIDIYSAKGSQYHVGETLLYKEDNHEMIEAIIQENIQLGTSIVWHGIKRNPNNPDKYSLMASRRLLVFDPETMVERFVGIIIVQYSLSSFNHKFTSDIRSGMSYIILDAKGDCIFSPNREMIGKDYFEHNKMQPNNPKDNFLFVRHNGEKVYLLRFESEMNGWQYFILLHDNYLSKITRGYTQGTMIILVLILLISIVINASYFHYMLSPIKKISNALQEIAHNRYDLNTKLANPHHDEIGELIKWFNHFVDTLLAAQSHRMELQTQKELAEKANEAKGVFLANISHELRTPLNGVISVAELMEATDLNEEQRDYLHTILQAGDILYSLINQVLDYSKIASNKVVLVPDNFDFIAFCDKLASIYRVQAGIKNIHFVYNKPQLQELWIYADEIALQKIIINLLGNSLKFTSQGEIRFCVTCNELTDNLVDIMIAVSDTGIGVPPEKQELIFQAFEQVDSNLAKKYEGTGLGLAIAQQLAALMNSRIMLQSPNPLVTDSSSIGTYFWLNLSLAKSTIPLQALQASKPVKVISVLGKCPRQLTSLIVEDNPINQKVLSTILNRFHIDTDIASDWVQCLEIMEKKKFDYIFMDIQMPGKTGLELTQILREKKIDTVIIAITGNALKDIEDKAYASGMNAFLVKPIRIHLLEEILLRYLPEECK